MRGHILVSKDDGRRWLYLPEAQIYLFVAENGHNKWVVAAFRSDGRHGRTYQDSVPTIEYLEQAFQWTAELEVPDHIGHFAVESERRRQESVEGIEEILTTAVRNQNPRSGFQEFMAQLALEQREIKSDKRTEDEIGEEISKLMAQAGGLQ